MPKWESNQFAKIHETCGGLVRWVEAYDDPHVGYTGQCIDCGSEGVVVEDIIPIELPAGLIAPDVFKETSPTELQWLDWDDEASWEDNQERFREVIS